MLLQAGSIFGRRYRVLRPLGRGGSATTWVVEDLHRQREGALALKLLTAPSADVVLAFRNEFARLRGLTHPHLCQVFDFGAELTPEGPLHFYTAELILGATLDSVAPHKSWSDLSAAICDALEALAFLHRLGIRHGDVKPENIVVRRDGRGVLIDLGCSRPLGEVSDATISGTRAYMAPELLLSGAGDARADLYALGVTLRGLGVELPGEVDDLVSRLTQEQQEERPSDTQEVLEALGRIDVDLRMPFARASSFVGRRAELELFADSLEKMLSRSPAPRAIVISGTRGVGCTRLLLEMTWRAQLRCAVVEASNADESPLVAALRRALGPEERGDFSSISSILEMGQKLATSSTPLVITYNNDDSLVPKEDDQRLVDALLRSMGQDGRFLFICTRRAPLSSTEGGVSSIELQPLNAQEIKGWVGDALSPRALEHLERLTGGYPAELEVCLAQLDSGELHEADLLAGTEWRAPTRSVDTSGLGEEEKAVLGALAISEGGHDEQALDRLGLAAGAVIGLHGSGWIEREGSRWKLSRLADAKAICGAQEQSVLSALHKKEATAIEAKLDENLENLRDDAPRRSALTADLLWHLAQGGEIEAAEELALESRKLYTISPDRWARAAEALSTADDGEGGREGRGGGRGRKLLAAEMTKRVGHPERALEILEGLDRLSSLGAMTEDHALLSASCRLTLGRTAEALELLDAAQERARSDGASSRIKELIARALLQQGGYGEARRHALEALEMTDDPGLMALLAEDAGLAASYLGEAEESRRRFSEAIRLHATTEQPRAKARVLTYQAINDFRCGSLEAAIMGYRAALKIAESRGFSDLLASAALNLGTAYQQYGDWGPALSSYERGLRIAIALSSTSTEVTLRFNMANLYAEIGMFERARAMIEVVLQRARASDLGYFEGAAQVVLGEISLAEGKAALAEEQLLAAKEIFEDKGTLREVQEVELRRVEVLILRDERAEAERSLDTIEAALEGLDVRDLTIRAHMLRGRIALSQSQGAVAITLFEEALRAADEGGQRTLFPQIELLLAAAFEQRAAQELSERHRRRARGAWERIAASLPEQLREVFWQHPRRKVLIVDSVPRERGSVATPTELHRFLEVNKRINSTLSVDKVLECAIDSAIEMTGAERGFVLLGEESSPPPPEGAEKLNVPVARNLDRERIGRSHLKFSRGIAEEVIRRGQPVVTVDAEDDARFRGNESVHAMRLKSVICVPISSPTGVLGALYLDNRFQRGRFVKADMTLLMAFGDQVAIALQNARLHTMLEGRTAALDAERKKVARLARGQAREIDRLHTEVRTRQEILEYRYDYSHIIGRGEAMQQLLATLDRVIDSSLSVLVQGESGTGKELIARAIHFNSKRRQSRFVSLNCAALPETLLESELFGHKRGAFTGADHDREGLLVAARGGTLFLDEVGEMPLAMQATLLRALQEREVRPLGSSDVVKVNLRLICATNRALLEEVEAGRFREDLYYRVAVVEVVVPPLRERTEDIEELSRHILSRLAEEASLEGAPRLGRDALMALMAHPFPGNVRQLENILARGFIMAREGEITCGHLGLTHRAPDVSEVALDRDQFEEEEARRILTALNTSRWNVAEVSRRLGIPRNTLYRKLKKYQIRRPGFASKI